MVEKYDLSVFEYEILTQYITEISEINS